MSDLWDQVAPPNKRELRPEHREILESQSGILSVLVDKRGYYSPSRMHIKKWVDAGVYHEVAMKAASWYSIPIYRPDKTKHCEVIRLVGYSGKTKYLWPNGYRNALDIHPLMWDYLLDSDIPLLITEGVKKADALLSASMAEDMECVVIAVNGCYGWRGKTNGGSVPLPDFQEIPLAKRRVITISDSDFRTNTNVRRGWTECAAYLSGKVGESRSSLVVVPANGLDKVGADDFLAAGNELSSLLGLAVTPQHALLDEPLVSDHPLEIRSGLELIQRAPDSIPHIIAPLLPERAIAILAGDSGTLKTWHAISLILDGAFSKSWIDHPDLVQQEQPFKSLYINREMTGALFENRLKKMARNPRYKDDPRWEDVLSHFIFSPEKLGDFNLQAEASRSKLEDVIQEYNISVVILDSLSMTWGGDENNNSEVGVFYAQLREITERTGVSWVIIHHTLKPASTRKKDHQMFSIRGAGQLVQQADAAMVLTRHDSPVPERREVKLAFVKTRTELEPPPFISALQDHDGMYIDITFVNTVSEDAATAYASARSGSPAKLQEFVLATVMSFPGMKPATSGMRTNQLLALLQQAWPVEDKHAPSLHTLRRALDALVERGDIECIEEDQRNGNLYRLPDPLAEDADDEAEATDEDSSDQGQRPAKSKRVGTLQVDASDIIEDIMTETIPIRELHRGRR